jgi:hypothetical protein
LYLKEVPNLCYRKKMVWKFREFAGMVCEGHMTGLDQG